MTDTIRCAFCGITFRVIDKPRPNAETGYCPEKPCRRLFQHVKQGPDKGGSIRMTVLREDTQP